MRPLTGSARALHRIRSGDEVTDSGSSTHSRRGGRRRSGRQNCKSNQGGKQYSQNGSPPAGHMQPQPDCDTGQVVTATGHTLLRIRGTARAEEDSALEQSVELMASVRDLPLPMTLARFSFPILENDRRGRQFNVLVATVGKMRRWLAEVQVGFRSRRREEGGDCPWVGRGRRRGDRSKPSRRGAQERSRKRRSCRV